MAQHILGQIQPFKELQRLDEVAGELNESIARKIKPSETWMDNEGGRRQLADAIVGQIQNLQAGAGVEVLADERREPVTAQIQRVEIDQTYEGAVIDALDDVVGKINRREIVEMLEGALVDLPQLVAGEGNPLERLEIQQQHGRQNSQFRARHVQVDQGRGEQRREAAVQRIAAEVQIAQPMQMLEGVRRHAFQLIARQIQRQEISQRQFRDGGQAIVGHVEMDQGVLQTGKRARRDDGQHVAGQLDADEILKVVEQPRRDLAHEVARQTEGHELRRRGADQFRGERGDAVELHVQVGEGR